MSARDRTVFDPRFPGELRRRRELAGLSLRRLAGIVHHGKSLLHQLESGRTRPAADVAARLDAALDAGGALAALVTVVPAGDERIAYAARHPRRTDAATVRALAALLAAHRRLEDSLGAAALLPAVRSQLDLVTALTVEATGALRPGLLDVAAQWAQFGGWLHAADGRSALAAHWYAAASDWGTEAGNADMIATVLSMRGHLAWSARRVGPLIDLSAAARRQPASPGVRAIAAQQQARGYALAGRATATVGLLNHAADLLDAARADPGREPDWIYFHCPAYLTMQTGLAYRLLGRNGSAVDRLRAGLDGLPPEAVGAAWTGPYLLHLAAALTEVGEADPARDAYAQALGIGRATRTRALVDRAEAGLRAVTRS
ncbi:helix-turn-helix domain-containing protein [Micromonospora fluostatini]|uniref:helix-turn-helix domain-containing protein n=1 Tax=Micromonospora sp. JCM 30529 TaxID=3421643 RepID=UPI003D16FE9D